MNLYLFDMDDTLLNVQHVHKEAFETFFKEATGTDSSFQRMFGTEGEFGIPPGIERTTHNLIRHALNGRVPGIEIERSMQNAVDSMVYLYMSKVNPLFLHSNVPHVLDSLGEYGMVAMFTGGARKVTHAILQKTGIRSKFQHISTCDDAPTRNEIVAHAIKNASLGVKFDKIFVIGDDIADIEAAKANNAVAVGVAMGFSSKEELKQAGADIIIEDWKDSKWVMEKLK